MPPTTDHAWVREFATPITVIDREGIIVEMNEASARMFAKDGGYELIGANCLDCHPESARAGLAEMLRDQRRNVYTIEKGGKKKLIFQTPWYQDGEYAGFVEMTVDLPDDMPHHLRD
jgi:transcriptional regulator with PAS, ATPase and Fis domain